jgi:hypothetical protein
MIKFTELKKGCHVMANFEGDMKRGEIEDIKNAEKQLCLAIGESSYWFNAEDLFPIEISDAELKNLQFTETTNEEGNIKYMKGAFRMLVPKPNDFSRMEIWYRDEQRHVTEPIPLHVLQNHFYEMTKVHLNEASFS